jgi:hypothetical protein
MVGFTALTLIGTEVPSKPFQQRKLMLCLVAKPKKASIPWLARLLVPSAKTDQPFMRRGFEKHKVEANYVGLRLRQPPPASPPLIVYLFWCPCIFSMP